MKIIYFSPIPYADIKQRPQHLAEELSQVHEVWYIDPTITGMRCLKKKVWDFFPYKYHVTSHLHVFRPNGLFAAHLCLQQYDPFLINTWFERLQLHKLISHADIIWIGYEGCYRLVRNSRILSSRNSRTPVLIYDKMDDNVSLEQNTSIRQFLKKMCLELQKKANIIFVSSTVFYRELQGKHPYVYHIPNGVGMNKKNIPETNKTFPLPPVPARRFGYIGTIGHWFDQELIRTLAAAMPDCEIALVGPVLIEKIDLPNIHYYGTIPKEDVEKWIQCFDVCLYPFKVSTFLDTIDPVKIYEYLAANKPVIAVESLETKKYGSCIYTYRTTEEFLDLCSLNNLQAPFSDRQKQKSFFGENSWEQRGRLILQAITAYMNQKETP